MLKGILMSILLATVVIPFRNARQPLLEAGLRRTRSQMFGFIVLWALACIAAYLYYGFV